MAVFPPLVIGTSGLIQNLQAGDNIGVQSETGQISLIAVATVVPGAPVYSSSATQFTKAQANAGSTAKVLGLAAAGITAAAAGIIQVNGILTLSTAQWDAITSGTGGLTFGANYFLSATTAGLLTTTAPSTVGQYNSFVGDAISTTSMRLDPQRPIQL